jgi:hypothetical protein
MVALASRRTSRRTARRTMLAFGSVVMLMFLLLWSARPSSLAPTKSIGATDPLATSVPTLQPRRTPARATAEDPTTGVTMRPPTPVPEPPTPSDGATVGPYCAKRSAVAADLRNLDTPHNRKGRHDVDVTPWGSRPEIAFAADGFGPVEDLPADSFRNLQFGSGYHCVVARDQSEGCIAATQAFVVTEESRGDTEYAVPASFLRRLPFYAAVIATKLSDGVAKGIASLSPTPVSRGPDVEETVERFRLTVSELAKRMNRPNRKHVGGSNVVVRHTAYAPTGTRALALVSLFDGVGTQNPNRDFVRVFLRAVRAEKAVKPNKPMLQAVDDAFPVAADELDHASSAYPMEAVGAVDVYGGLGSAVLRAVGTQPRAPWLVEHELNARGALELDPQFAVEATVGDAGPAPVELPVTFFDLTAFTSVRDSAGLSRAVASDDCRGDRRGVARQCLLRIEESFTIEADISVAAGTVIAVDSGMILKVAKELRFEGVESALVFVTRSAPQVAVRGASLTEKTVHSGNWGGFSVKQGASLVAVHTVFAFAGGSNKRAKNTGTHIKDACPIVVAEPGSAVRIRLSALLHSRGPGIGAGEGATIEIDKTLFHDLAQGGECVGCEITISGSVFANFMLRPATKQFVDRDNDGFYFRGGHAHVDSCTFVNMLDDCIDTASSKNTPPSDLTIENTVLANCQHEGIALSASVGTKRTVTVSNTLIAWTQQGVENGYTPDSHVANLTRVTFVGNQLALRYGDNYDLEVAGKLNLRRCRFLNNHVDVLNFVKRLYKEDAPRHREVPFGPWSREGFAPLRGAADYARRATVEDSEFSTPSRASVKALEKVSGALRLDGGRSRGASNWYEFNDFDAAIARADDAAYVFPRLGPGWSSADPVAGVYCGERHFQALRNRNIDPDTATADDAEQQLNVAGESPTAVGCYVSSMCNPSIWRSVAV